MEIRCSMEQWQVSSKISWSSKVLCWKVYTEVKNVLLKSSERSHIICLNLHWKFSNFDQCFLTYTKFFKFQISNLKLSKFSISSATISNNMLTFVSLLRAGRINAASVSFGDQVIVFGGHLGHIGQNPVQNLGMTDLIGEVSLNNCWNFMEFLCFR